MSALSPDGQTFASDSFNEDSFKLWDIETGGLKTTLRGHPDAVTSVSFSPNGRALGATSYDRTIKFWDMDVFFGR